MRKRDLFDECSTQGVPPKEFKAQFCRRCKNPECVHAEWGDSAFSARIATQAERFFNPTLVDPNLSKYQPVISGWKNMLKRAVQLEVANLRGDWVVPEIPVSDGQIEVSSPAMVDDAIRAMARMSGRNGPLPEEPAIKEVQEPAVEEAPKADLSSDQKTDPSTAQKGKKAFVPRATNTQGPKSGVMVGGGPPPPPTAPKPARDPWAPPEKPAALKVNVGGVVKLGSKGD